MMMTCTMVVTGDRDPHLYIPKLRVNTQKVKVRGKMSYEYPYKFL